jgi:outer membrane protein assembly factor BamB
MKNFVLALTLVLSLLANPNANALEPKTPDWTHMHGDAYHTAYSQVEIAPPLKLLWKKAFDVSAHVNVVACWHGDVPLIISGDVNGYLMCMKPDTGELIWRYKAGSGSILGSPVIFTSKTGVKRIVTVSSQTLRNGSSIIEAHCVDMEGKQIWMNNLQGTFCESSPTFQDGFLYIATGSMSGGSSSGGYLHKINADDGQKVWSARLPNAPATASPSKIGNHVFIFCSNLSIGDYDGRWLGAYLKGAVLSVVNDSTGVAENKLDFGNMRMDILTVFDGTDLIISGHTVVEYVDWWVDPRNPERVIPILREVPKNLVCRINPIDLSTNWKTYPYIYNDGDIYAHSPIVSNDWVITGADGGMIYAYNKKDATKNWSYKQAIGVRLCMAASENFIYLNEGDTPPNCCPDRKAKFKVIDIDSGRTLWEYTLDKTGLGGVTVFDQYVYTFDRGSLFCFSKGEPPILMVDPQEIDLGKIPQGKIEKTSFKVWNGGAGTLSGTLKFIEPYMKLSSNQFMVDSTPKQFICTIDTKTLEAGKFYNVTVMVSATNGEKKMVLIKFEVTGQPKLKVTPPKIDFGTVEFGTYSESTIYIDNIGDGTLKGTCRSDSGWLTLEYNAWEGNHKKLTITADTTMLDYNKTFKANIYFESNGGYEKVEVVIRIKQKGPRLIVTPTDFNFPDMNWDQIIEGTFGITNGGILTLEGTIETARAFVVLNATDFTLTTEPKEVKFRIDCRDLPDGEETKTYIIVKSNAGAKQINIRINIKPRPPQLKVDPPTIFFRDVMPNDIVPQSFTVSNIGSGILSGTIKVAPGAPWLEVKVTNFDISKTSLTVPVILDTTGMTRGSSYTGKIIVDSNGGYDEIGIVVTVKPLNRHKVELWIGSIEARVDGKPEKLDWPPYIKGGATMVPARFVTTALNCIVDFYPKHKAVEEVYISKGSTQITLYIGKKKALLTDQNGVKEIELDYPPEIKNGRTFVPIRFISEVFGADISWDKDTQKVTISYVSD